MPPSHHVKHLVEYFVKFAPFFIAGCALSITAAAQKPIKNECPPASLLKASELFGEWTVRFARPPAGLPQAAVMRLERHEEFADSLAGTVVRELPRRSEPSAPGEHAAQAQLAGDLEDGALLLDESSDNVSITGTWNGEMVEGSCGKVFRGTWKDTRASAPANAPDVPFTLTRKP